MPVEIRELHIKAVVNESGNNNTSVPAGQPEGSNAAPQNKDDIVAACVEKVMEILNLKKER